MDSANSIKLGYADHESDPAFNKPIDLPDNQAYLSAYRNVKRQQSLSNLDNLTPNGPSPRSSLNRLPVNIFASGHLSKVNLVKVAKCEDGSANQEPYSNQTKNKTQAAYFLRQILVKNPEFVMSNRPESQSTTLRSYRITQSGSNRQDMTNPLGLNVESIAKRRE